MSSHSRGSTISRITPVTTRERNFVLANTVEDYLANSPSVAGDTIDADHAHAMPDRAKLAETGPQRARSVWLLVVWLVVSILMIALASLVIAKYFW